MRRLFKDEIIKDTMVVFFANSAVNVINLLFQLYMLRNLTAVDYGVLNSLLSLLIILAIPVSTVHTAVIKFVSKFTAHKQWAKIKYLLLNLGKHILIGAGTFFLIIILMQAGIARFLQISQQSLVVILALAVFFSSITPLVFGGLQGMQRFGYLGLSSIVGGASKLILGVIFIKLGLRVFGAMNAFVISIFISFLLSVFPLSYFLSKEKSLNLDRGIDFFEIYRYFFPVAVTILCIMVLTNIDIILVKHFFKPQTAGLYSVAQMVGKIIYFLPGAVTIVMFPKVSGSYAQSKKTLPIFKKSLTIVILVCSVASLFCILFPSAIVKFLSGKIYPELFPLVRLFSIVMIPFAMINLILHYKLSIHNLRYLFPLVVFTVLQVILIVLFHHSLLTVLYIMLGNSIALLVILFILLNESAEKSIEQR